MMVSHFKFCIVIFLILKLILDSTATTHWFVTQNGKIRSQCGSAFRMNQPHDLLSFLNQEKSLQNANILYEKGLIDRQWIDISSIMNMEQKLRSLDSNSPFANHILSDINFFTTIVTNSSVKGGME